MKIDQGVRTIIVITFVMLAASLISGFLSSPAVYSQTFTIQQLTDPPNDLSVLSFGTVKNCSKGNMSVPDIVAFAYYSNGKTLNSTLWLKEPFKDPSKIRDDTNVTFSLIDVKNRTQIRSFKNSHLAIEPDGAFKLSQIRNEITNKTASGVETRTYTYRESTGALMIVQKSGPLYYIITFSTDNHLFPFYWPKVKKIFSSLDINGSRFANFHHSLLGLDVRYQPDWVIQPIGHNASIVKLVPDDPRWSRITVASTIQVISSPTYGEPHSDYRVSLEWSTKTKKWTQVLEQISAYQKNVKPESTILAQKTIKVPDFVNAAGGGSHINLGVDLSLIGQPRNYVVFSNVASYFLRADGPEFCSLIDYTNWVPLPPPKIDISLVPNSFNIIPGEIQTAELRANSSSNLPSSITLGPTSYQGVKFNFFPAKIYLSSYGRSGSTVQIIPSNNLLKYVNGSKDITVPITGYIDFPQNITDTSTGFSYKSTQVEKIASQSFLHLSIQSWWDRFFQQSTWLLTAAGSSLNQFAGMLLAIGTITGTILAFVIKVRKQIKSWLGAHFGHQKGGDKT